MVRDATAEDWPAIRPIHAQIVRAADTLCYDPAIGEDAPAVQLYERVGFTIVGRVPGAFRHPEQGEVALLVMQRPL